MSWRAVRLNEEVQACRPNTCQWRAARVMEDANQGQHSAVRVKFIGDTAVYCIPWASIKLYQYPNSGSLFSRPVVTRSKNSSSQKIVSIDLTEPDDISSYPRRHHGAPKHSTHNSQTENGHLHSPPHGKQETPSFRHEAVTNTPRDLGPLVSARSKQASTSVTVQPPPSSSNQNGTSLGANESDNTAFPCRDNEIVWEWNPIHPVEQMQTSSETGFAQHLGNTSNASVLRINGNTDIESKPLERHPGKGVEDIPIPRNLLKPNESKLIGHNGESLRGKVRSVNGSVRPSKRPRPSYDIQSQLATLLPPHWSTLNVSRRLQKKQRQSHVLPSQEDPELQRGTTGSEARKYPNDTLPKFQPITRFPFAQEHDNMDDVDKHVKKSCADMVSEHKNEVKAMLEALDDLKLAKKPPKIQNRSGRRKSAKPRSWGHRKLTEQTIFENITDFSYPQQGTVGGVPSNSSQNPAPNPRKIRCVCGAVDADGGTGASHAAVRCEVCGFLTHVKCIQFEDTDLDKLGFDGSANAKRFVCSFCVDDATDCNVTKIATGDGSDPTQYGFTSGKSNPFPGCQLASAKGQDWQSHVAPVVTVERSIKPPNLRSRRKASIIPNRPKYRPRTPLSESEVEARALNIDFLRAGVLKRSVGAREQELIDSKTPTFSP
ncbi:hypothetical protein BWQ96_08705 [Gracilariopsis chorda]|uniref:Zinc finger PHD-type domain-containing protein n=1 Tax=Gracilariopsis chorda TaxID=448386 RepID=A0A2V3IKA6_9FLOR|nr:hypothetical protein BWQ96_08705 [Gracilariopsis chorda]|eukprot:PXF41560.1 hypothetical protein BWQ96_08705 [Gracilariopsis chorda]